MLDLTAIILTYNEEKNIVSCIESIKPIAKRIIVVDSFSSDDTVELSKKMGAEVYQNKWVNYATQYNWGIDRANVDTEWILRIDADERISKEASKEIEDIIQKADKDIAGIIVRFKVTFLGRELKHGGIYPFRKLLLYKNGFGYMENRNMDEHIILKSGKAVSLKNDSYHYDYKDLTEWIDKHNKYSSREVLDYFQNKKEEINNMNGSAKVKRWIKYNLYYKLPMGFRAHLYYIYRYYFKFGFLDGKEGKIFNFLQAYWYRYLVDAKIFEVKDEIHEKTVGGDKKHCQITL